MRVSVAALILLCTAPLGAASVNAHAGGDVRSAVRQGDAASAGSPSSGYDRRGQRAFPVAEQVTARATVLRPARIRFARPGVVEINVREHSIQPQRRRDRAGTMWVEFN